MLAEERENQEKLESTTADPEDVLKGETFYTGEKIFSRGIMEDNGAVAPTALGAGQSYTIPKGYHNGLGTVTVTAKTLAEQTPGTATAADILLGKTAWVNGNPVTGTMTESGAAIKPNVENVKAYQNCIFIKTASTGDTIKLNISDYLSENICERLSVNNFSIRNPNAIMEFTASFSQGASRFSTANLTHNNETFILTIATSYLNRVNLWLGFDGVVCFYNN